MKNFIKTTLLLLALLLPATAAAYDFEVDGLYYNITGVNTVEVTYRVMYEADYYGNVVIPAAVTHDGTTYSVTAIGERAFEQCSGLRSVTIPGSVTIIASIAFWNCSGLRSMTIPSSVTLIKDRAFYGCTGLTNIVVESGNPNYDSRDNCNAIIKTSSNSLIVGCKNTVIPNTVTAIGDNAFAGCYDLTSISIPNSVTSIGNSAFSSCRSLASVTISNSVIYIGNYAFDGCRGLTSIVVESGNPKYDSRDNCNAIIETSINTLINGCKNTVIPNTVTAIGECAFRGCEDLTSVTIPNSVISIGRDAFHGCRYLRSVTFGNSLTYIDYYAFEYCRALTSVTIPSTVTFIGEGAFSSCNSLASIVVESGNPTYDSRDNCNAIIKTSSNTLMTGCKNTVIPKTVTAIGNSAFSGSEYLTTITIPSSVTKIGMAAFFDCYGLKDVYSYIVDPSVVSMGTDAFYKNPVGSDYSYRTLHVPQGTVSVYQANQHWSPYFGQIVEMEPEVFLLGDVNGDGEVNITDVNVVTGIIMGETLDAETMERADVNEDGSINISDINAIINIILNPAEVEEHEYVDLGLPSGTLWATCNVGASAPEQYGDYFAWGETEPKEVYNWETYKWCNGSDDTLTKYCTDSEYGTVDGKTVLDPQDDAAFVNWGLGWRMPTEAQIYELRSYTSSTRTEVNGVKGRLITGRNGNSIFLPGSGEWNNGGGAGGYSGDYWSCSGQNRYAFGLWTDSGGNSWGFFNDFRYAGHTIRPVRGASTDFYIVEQSLDLGIEHVGELHTGHVTIVNNTMEEMTFTATVDEPFLLQQGEDFVSSMDIVVTGGSTTPLTVAFNGTASGQYNGNVTIKSAAPDGGETVIPVKIIAYAEVSAEQEYLDMGLPSGTLWATCNLGASSPEQYGDHFAWGETEPKEVYNWETYKLCKGSENTLTKYCSSSEYGTVDGKTELESEDDAAFVNLGPEWRMPTEEQIWELELNCTWRWTTVNGVYGELVIGSNGNTLFFPLTGEMRDSTLEELDWYGYYWTRELSKFSDADIAAGMGFNYGSQWVGGFGTRRCYGCAVRAVRVSQQ